MASATLSTLVGTSKPAVTNTGGIAAALLAAGSGGTSGAGSAIAGTGVGGTPGSTPSAPATIVDFLAMLSGMIQTPQASETSGAAATVAANPDALKSDPSKGDGMSELYAQLLALMQSGAGDGAAQAALAAASGAGAVASAGNSAVPGADAAGAAGTSGLPAAASATGAAATTAAAGQQTAAQTAADNQRALIAKLLGQGAGTSESADDADDTTSTGGGGKSIASLLEKDLQSLFDGGNSTSPASSVSLSDLSALLGQTATGANTGSAQAGSQPDPSLLQAAAAASAPSTGTGATAAASDSATAAHAHLTAPVGTAAWTEQLGTHLTWMAGNDQQSASLKLTPPHLGPLEVQITMGDDNKASVWFSAPHADTRAALGEALPRLRELFGASGLTLSDANVSREPSKQKPRQQAPDASVSAVSAISGDDGTSSASSRLAALHAGILDTYA